MVLFLTSQNEIYAANGNLKKEDISFFKNAVWYDGDFSFFDEEEREGFYKIFRWDGSKAVVEYKEILKNTQQELTQLDSIEQTQLLIMEAMADQYEQRLETDLMMMDAQATTFEAVLSLSEGGV